MLFRRQEGRYRETDRVTKYNTGLKSKNIL